MKRDIVIFEIESQTTMELTEQDLNDIHSAIGYCQKNYPSEGAVKFKSALKKIDKKFWKFIREMPE